MARRSRSLAKAKNAASSPKHQQQEDHTVDTEASPSNANTPTQDANDDAEADVDADGDEDADDDADDKNAAASPVDQDEDSPGSVARTPTPATRGTGGRRRRLGRPPRNRGGSRWTGGVGAGNDGNDDGVRSETTTPVRRGRGRGRPWGSGFRGRGRGSGAGSGPSHLARIPLDKDGNPMEVANDEIVLPIDPEGETKVDSLGNLQAGREYRVRTFTLPSRGGRLYMLSTEPARCTGFRDSYLFFTKHIHLHKIIINDAEKHDIIKRDIIPHSYKGRAIGVVTARSVFREFGARIIVGGRRIIDDYNVKAARERGDIEGELADPYDRLPPPGEPYNRNQYVAWHGASSVYHTNQQANMPTMPGGKIPPGAKRRVNITSANWQVEHARAASQYNSTLATARRAALAGVYDPHCNMMLYPRASQPTHARWEQLYPPTTDNTEESTLQDRSSTSSNFPPLPPLLLVNHLTTDTVFESPPFTGLGVPGPDGDAVDIGINGLSQMEDLLDDCKNVDDEVGHGSNVMSNTAMDVDKITNGDQDMQDIKPDSDTSRALGNNDDDDGGDIDVNTTIPQHCREALATALAAQKNWQRRWHTETTDGARGRLKMGFVGVPV